MGKTEQQLNSTLQQISDTLLLDTQIVKKELRRVEELLKDATENISESFHSMHRLTHQQAQLTKEIIQYLKEGRGKEAEELNAKLATISELAEALDLNIDKAIRSLQFEDITTQSLNSIEKNISALKEVAGLIVNLVDQDNHIDLKALTVCTKRCEELNERAQKNDLSRSVSQNCMGAGEVEIF